MIKHIVMFRFKPAAQDKKNELKRALEALPAQIKEIQFFEVGLNFIESPAAYDLVLTSEFESLETLDSYRVHPEHQKVVGLIQEYCSERAVVDYQCP